MSEAPIFFRFGEIIFPLSDFHYANTSSTIYGFTLDSGVSPTLVIHLKDGTEFKFYGPTLDEFENALQQAKEKHYGTL